ncbi:MAG TPA: protein translocase subunit SecD [Coxiellaceae bacterium]|nr:protein translocase subunit SecD [Coxiellaceae bacterium]
MNQYPLWRYFLLAALVLWGVLYAIPNWYGDYPAVQISNKNSPVDELAVQKIAEILQQQSVAHGEIKLEKDDVVIAFSDTTQQLEAQDLLKSSLGSDFVVAANLVPKTPAWLQHIGANPMHLGLDLRGGIHFLLAVDINAMLTAHVNGDLHSMADQLRRERIRYAGIHLLPDHGMSIQFRNEEDRDAGAEYLHRLFPDYAMTNSGVNALDFKLSEESIVKITNYAIDQNMTTLRNRVNALGVVESVVQRQGVDHISVDLPGIQDAARAKDMIGKVATIRLQLVDIEHDARSAKSGLVPFGSHLYEYQNQAILLKDQVVLKGESIINAAPSFDQNGRSAVSIRLNGSGTELFNRVTAANIGKPLSVVYVETIEQRQMVDGKEVITHQPVESIISIATIQSALGNNFEITGLESEQYAKNLALLLRSGAYSAPVSFVEERLVGPSLGAANIRQGVMSTLIGSLVVILFMAFYYRVFGLIADMALLLNIVFIVAILSVLGATLTLPGIAGIVLTVGMAVDANVLINERIREELRNGMSAQASIAAGYQRAFATIVDANVTTLIVALVLFALGSGSVQNFAVTLIIGLLTSMVTAIFFTRAVVNLVYGRRNVKKLSIGI